MANGTWQQLQTQFNQTDIDHMNTITGGAVDLSDCTSVRVNAQEIYDRLTSTDPNRQMPPGGWPTDYIANFKAWMDSGAVCPPGEE
jgi:hypothetical protein